MLLYFISNALSYFIHLTETFELEPLWLKCDQFVCLKNGLTPLVYDQSLLTHPSCGLTFKLGNIIKDKNKQYRSQKPEFAFIKNLEALSQIALVTAEGH